MGSGFASCSLLFWVLLVLQYASARELTKEEWNNVDKEAHNVGRARDHLKIYAKQDDGGVHNDIHFNDGDHRQNTRRNHVYAHSSTDMDLKDPALHIFFTFNDLYLGKKLPIYFPIIDPSTSPHLLPRDEADSIPFSSSQLQYLLEFFSFSKGSPQAKAMENTLGQCEVESIKGETKFCATSLESMLDSTRGVLGLETRLKVLTTITHFSNSTTPLQNYTVVEVPQEIKTPKVLACHTMAYPYAVYYCHCQEGGNKLFKVSLGCENGDSVEAVAVCHMDTTQWDRDHVAFRVLKIQPGTVPVCHFFPPDNLVWIPSPSVIY